MILAVSPGDTRCVTPWNKPGNAPRLLPWERGRFSPFRAMQSVCPHNSPPIANAGSAGVPARNNLTPS
ncbi:MAG: hypothetical protein IJS89_04255, partial [Bacteroidaceae bacterium]|nr:hypothetical protein [Bacteroidaceae bacterium]